MAVTRSNDNEGRAMQPNPDYDYSAQQLRVLAAPGATLVGFDAKGRPVVEQPKRWSPGQSDRWAIKKDGDPIDVVEPVR